MVDRDADADHPLLPYPATGDTERAIIRPAPDAQVRSGGGPLIAYLATDAALPRRQCVALPLGPNGWRGQSGVLAPREDAELEGLDADDAGHLLLLVWNVTGGRSEVELYDTRTDRGGPARAAGPGRHRGAAQPGRHPGRGSGGGSGPAARGVDAGRGDRRPGRGHRAAAVPLPDGLVEPELVTFPARDGLELSGWLYRVPGRTEPGPAMLSLHGGPEAQERPTFNPQHQAMVAAGIAVFAPNIRGLVGFRTGVRPGRRRPRPPGRVRRRDRLRAVPDRRRGSPTRDGWR